MLKIMGKKLGRQIVTFEVREFWKLVREKSVKSQGILFSIVFVKLCLMIVHILKMCTFYFVHIS